MLNSHQILAGARTKGGIKTYVDADYVVRPEVTLTGSTLSFDGAIELDGEVFPLNDYDLDLSTVASVLMDGDYIVGAVPSYEEPADRSAAEGAGQNYYVTTTAAGDTILHYFLPAALEAEVKAAGGYDKLYKARAMGAATNAEIQLVNRYSDELEKLSDPRYVGQLLVPTGVEYVLKRIVPQDNSSRRDALVGMNNQQIELFIATQGYIAAQRSTYGTGDAFVTGDNNGVLAKIKRAFAYESSDDAAADVDGVEIRLDYKNGDTLSDPVDLDGTPITYGAAAGEYDTVAVFEYYQPTYMSKGHHGTNPDILDTYTKQDSLDLGRLNPIYLARDFEVARVSAGRGMPLGALTKYGHPLSVAKFNKDGTSFTASTKYTPGAFVPAGGPTPTP